MTAWVDNVVARKRRDIRWTEAAPSVRCPFKGAQGPSRVVPAVIGNAALSPQAVTRLVRFTAGIAPAPISRGDHHDGFYSCGSGFGHDRLVSEDLQHQRHHRRRRRLTAAGRQPASGLATARFLRSRGDRQQITETRARGGRGVFASRTGLTPLMGVTSLMSAPSLGGRKLGRFPYCGAGPADFLR